MIKMIQTPTLEKVDMAVRSCGIAIRLVLCLVFLWPVSLLSQSNEQDETAPLLTLDEAVSLALKDNRLVKNSGLEALKYDFQVSTIRSRRLPQFEVSALGGELMHSYDFTFPAGSWGTSGDWADTRHPIRNPNACAVCGLHDGRHK